MTARDDALAASHGIDASHLQRNFDPFVQADDPAQRQQGGTGLGLSISRQLVRAMGGELSVESVHGLGSTFRFALRLEITPEAAATPLDDFGDVASSECLSGRVLLVEDNPVNQMVGIAMLESLGLQVVATDNGEEALAKMAEIAFAMVLMDCHMPALDGYDATRRRRETERRDETSAGQRRPLMLQTRLGFGLTSRQSGGSPAGRTSWRRSQTQAIRSTLSACVANCAPHCCGFCCSRFPCRGLRRRPWSIAVQTTTACWRCR